MWAKMKSAYPRSGEIPMNCNLFCGLDCRRKQTKKDPEKKLKHISKNLFQGHLTGQHEAAHTRDEARQEGVEGKGANEHTIDELHDSGEQNVNKIGVDDFKLLWCVALIFIVEL